MLCVMCVMLCETGNLRGFIGARKGIRVASASPFRKPVPETRRDCDTTITGAVSGAILRPTITRRTARQKSSVCGNHQNLELISARKIVH